VAQKRDVEASKKFNAAKREGIGFLFMLDSFYGGEFILTICAPKLSELFPFHSGNRLKVKPIAQPCYFIEPQSSPKPAPLHP
jgi:hypothetical protein